MPDSWFHAAVRSGQLTVVKSLYHHLPQSMDFWRRLDWRSEMLEAMLEHPTAAIYTWFTDPGGEAGWCWESDTKIPCRDLPITHRAYRQWKSFLQKNHTSGYHNPLWARGFVRCIMDRMLPYSDEAIEDKAFWAQVRDWATHKMVFVAGSQSHRAEEMV